MNSWKLWHHYLYEQRKSLILFVLLASVFTVVLFLYGLPLDPVLYGGIFCLVIAGFFLLHGFWRFQQKYRVLEEIKAGLPLNFTDLPEAEGLTELEYQDLLKLLYAHGRKLQYESDSKVSDLKNFYTLWVHQIKNPIAAMSLLLQTTESGQNTALGTELFRIEEYVQMVLNYLRLDDNVADLVLKRYDVDSIVKQAIRKYARLFVLKKIRLKCAALSMEVLADEKWLVFVIEQLLSNALKYTDSGEIAIYLEERILVIADTGIGIQPEDLPRVFEKGFTGYNGRVDKKSTGIGLYLCKRMMDKLGYGISIQSEVGKGTKVFLNLTDKDMVVE